MTNPLLLCKKIHYKHKHDKLSSFLFFLLFASSNTRVLFVQVYCDMTTDGGGYILLGYINDTVTWDVPSNNKTVKPSDDPHWSSEFGYVPVLDFRIQVASGNDIEKTRAHW